MLQAITVLEHLARQESSEGKDVLLLGGMGVLGGERERLYGVCRRIAGLWPFARIEETPEDRLSCTPDEWARETSLLANRFAEERPDRVLVCRNWQFVNEVALAAFPRALKTAYGDGYGLFDYLPEGTPSSNCEHGLVAIDDAYAVFPGFSNDHVVARPWNRVDASVLDGVLRRAADLFPELDAVAATLERQVGGDATLLLTSGYTEAYGLADLSVELEAVLDVVLPATVHGERIVIKGHPRQRHGLASKVADRLVREGRSVFLLDDLLQVPIELLLHRWKPARAFPFTSYCSVGLAWIARCDLHLGFGRLALSRIFSDERLITCLIGEESLAVAARNMFRNNMDPVVYHDRGAQGQFHEKPIYLTEKGSVSAERFHFPARACPASVAPESAGRVRRLHLGSGRKRMLGYLDVDAYVGAQGILPVSHLELPHQTSSVDEILSEHSLEHIGKYEVPLALAEWSRVLRPGGRLHMNLPNLEWCMKAWLATPEEHRWGWQLDTLFGLQDHPGEYHKTGFTAPRLQQLLTDAGFKDIRIDDYWSHGQGCFWVEAVRDGAVREPGEGRAAPGLDLSLLDRRGFGPVDRGSGKALFGRDASFTIPVGLGTAQVRLRFDLELPTEGLSAKQEIEIHVRGQVLTMKLDESTPTGVVSLDFPDPKGDIEIALRCARATAAVGGLEIGAIIGRIRILASSEASTRPSEDRVDPALESTLSKALSLHLGGDHASARRRFAPGIALDGGARMEKALILLQTRNPEAALWEIDGIQGMPSVELLRALALLACGETDGAIELLGRIDASTGLEMAQKARALAKIRAWQGDWSGAAAALSELEEWTGSDLLLHSCGILMSGRVAEAVEQMGRIGEDGIDADGVRGWFEALIALGHTAEARGFLEQALEIVPGNGFEWRIRALALDAVETGGLRVDPVESGDENLGVLEEALRARARGDLAEEMRLLTIVKERQTAGSILSRVIEAREVVDRIPCGRREPIPPRPKASIVIPVYDGLDLTRDCIRSIREVGAKAPYEIVVVDDSSSDGTNAYLRGLRDAGQIVLVEHCTNAGFAASCNDGAKAASGDVLVFLNNDTLARPGWLDALLDELVRDESVGVVGSQLMFADGRIQHAGLVWRWGGDHPFPEHIFRFDPGNLAEARVALDYPCVTGACMAVPKALFEEMGMLSEKFGMYCEDADFCLRVWDRGLRVRYAPTSRFVHLESATPIDQERRLERSRKASEILYASWDGRWPKAFEGMPAWMWPRQAKRTESVHVHAQERMVPKPAPAVLDIASAIKGRIPIAMPAYNRDDYLRQVLDALRRCDNLDRFFIVTGEEPDCPGTRALFDAVDWIPVVRTRNPQRLGCNANVVGTIDRAFELSETAVVLEDDIVPSQDFLSFVLWGLDRFRNDPGVFSVCGYQRLVQPPSPEIAPVVGGFDWFSPWGWATWRNRWEAFRRDARIPSDSSGSWDCFVVEWAVKRQGLREMRPLVGRVQNIGEEGTWVPSAQWQRDNQFTPHWMGNLGWKSVAIPEFRLQGDGERPAQAVSERLGDVGRSSLSGVLATIAAGLRTGDRNGRRKESRIGSDTVAAAPNSSARILLDLRTLADPNSISRGIGHYSLHLARAILARGGHRFGVLWDDRAGLERRPDLGDTVFEWVAYSTYQPGSWDLVHVFDPMGNHPNYEDPFTLFSAEPRLSLTFYDLIPWHMYRESMGRYWEVYLTRLERMKKSDATCMCISRFTADDLVRVSGMDPMRTEVVMAGLNAHREPGRGESHDRSLIGKLGIDGPFCLYVGAVDPHKNLEGAMQAWIRARMSIPGLKLVVVGRRNGLVQEFEQQVKAKGFADGITFTGFLERDVLEALYRRSIATLFLSRFEGFGFPVLEAMAADCPVICSDATSIPEVAGDAAIVCGPEDHDAAATALVRLHRDADLRSSMIARGNRQAALFTWDKVAVAVCARWGRELGCPPRTTTDLRRIAPSYIEMSAPIYDPSGYAAEARPVLNHLIDVGMPVKAIAIGRTSTTFREGCPAPMREAISIASDRRSSDGLFVQVIWFPGYAFKRNPQAAWNVGRTMFETDSLPGNWVDPCNSMDEIWVPTDFNLETFRKAGVTVPLLKVPGGVDTETYRPGLEPLPLPGRAAGTTYLSVFEWTARKGFDVLLKGWARAFDPSDDVRLVLRAYPPNAIEGDPVAWVTQQIDKTLASVGSSRDRCAPILVIASQVPEADMPRLYAAADVYLAPSRGEGWGRPHMEAMSCGVPVVATRWSGNLEFQDDDNSWLIDVEKLVPVGKEMAFQFYHGQKWAEPSLDSFVELLGRSWKDVEGRRAKAERARRDMVGRWDWSISARFVSERLAEILQGIPPGQSHLADPAWVRALRDPSSCDPGSAAESFNSAGEQDASEGDRSAHEEADGSLSIRWEGSQFVHHSLAHVNRQLCVGLAKRGHDLSIIPYESDQFGPGMDPDLQILGQLTNAPLDAECQIHVRHQWPPNLVAPKEGRWVVVQPWEFGSPPRDWMPAFRERVDEIWAYTGYVRDMYVRAGVPEDRVHVVPLGVDCDNFRPGIAPLASLPPKRGLRFLYVGGSIARKGFDVLLDAWQKAFGPDDPVELLIKDMGGKGSYKGQTGERFVRRIQESGRFATIHYVDDDLSPSDLPALYASGDVLVHPYRGEGFGLPIAEAMACGLPVIVTDGGAADDFCGSDEAWKLPSRKVLLPGGKVDQMETVEPPWWLEPSEEALIAALREAATNEGMRREKGERARQRIAEGFTWAHSVERAEARLRALASRPVRRGNQPATLDASFEGLRSQGSGAAYAAAEAQLEDMSQSLLEIEALLGRQRFEEAEELTAKLVEEHPGRHMAWVTRAIVYRGMKKTGKALEALKKAAEVGGGPEVHYETMALLLQTGKEGPARVQWNILREQFPAWVERQRAAHREQGTPWLPDRLKPHSKAKPARTGRR